MEEDFFEPAGGGSRILTWSQSARMFIYRGSAAHCENRNVPGRSFQLAARSLAIITAALLAVCPASVWAHCCCEAAAPAAQSCDTSSPCCCGSNETAAQAASSCCLPSQVQPSTTCDCEECHCLRATAPIATANPRGDVEGRDAQPLFGDVPAVLEPMPVIASHTLASTPPPLYLPRPVRELFCVWVI